MDPLTVMPGRIAPLGIEIDAAIVWVPWLFNLFIFHTVAGRRPAQRPETVAATTKKRMFF